MCFVPFVWGLGLLAAAAIVTFRRGGGVIGIGMSVLGLASGAFFPLALLPHWIQTLSEANPMAITVPDRASLAGGDFGNKPTAGVNAFAAAGADPAAIQSTVDAFRAALGPLNPNQAGVQNGGAGRREPPFTISEPAKGGY